MGSTTTENVTHETGGDSTMNPQDAAGRLGQGTGVLIDVRTPAEFREVHAEGAINRPLDSLSPETVTREDVDDDRQILVICRSGNRSAQACRQFSDRGIHRAVSIDGGTQAWEAAGLPVVRGRKTISLDRQMRITAGSLVVLGAIVGALIHPAGYAVSALIGAGLVYAGASDTCPMSSMLAKMPWNR